MEQVVTEALFLEFIDLHFHLDPALDPIYLAGTCCFHFYFFFRRDFAVPLTHPLFDSTAPYITIPIYMAHPFPTLATAVAPAAPLASPPQQVPFISLDDDDDPSEAMSSSSSSSAPGNGYALVDASMANGFLSSESI